MKSRMHLVRVTIHAEVDVAIGIPEDEDLPEEAERRAEHLMLAEALSDEIHEAMHASYEDVTEGLTGHEIRSRADKTFTDERYRSWTGGA